MKNIIKILYLISVVSGLFSALCSCSSADDIITDIITGGVSTLQIEGVELFGEESRNVLLTQENSTVEIEFDAGSEVALYWVTSQEISEQNLYHNCRWQGGIAQENSINGNFYVPNRTIEDLKSGEIVSLLYAERTPLVDHSLWYGNNLDGAITDQTFFIFNLYDEEPIIYEIAEQCGIEIVDTRSSGESLYDCCDMTYRGWLKITIGSRDGSHRFIKLTAIADAPDGYDVARIYFSSGYMYIENLITVTQIKSVSE